LKRASPANPLFKNYKKISGSTDTPPRFCRFNTSTREENSLFFLFLSTPLLQNSSINFRKITKKVGGSFDSLEAAAKMSFKEEKK
jgi:hypothetical protein